LELKVSGVLIFFSEKKQTFIYDFLEALQLLTSLSQSCFHLQIQLVCHTLIQSVFIIILIQCYCGLNSGPARQMLYHLSYSALFLRKVLSNCLPGLALNLDPPDLSLLNI
jgi:hypothetical protein